MVITRRQVLVQLDDELLARLDDAAAAVGVSRSELLRRGAQAMLEAMDNVEKDRRLQAAYRRQPEDGDAFVQTAGLGWRSKSWASGTRGADHWADLGSDGGRRPVVVLTRDAAIMVRTRARPRR